VKARLFKMENPFNNDDFLDDVRTAIREGTSQAAADMLISLRDVLAVFQYLQNDAVRDRFLAVRKCLREQASLINFAVPAARNEHFQDWWNEYDDDVFDEIERRARIWVSSDTVSRFRTIETITDTVVAIR
jgi:hypothetical protein